MELLEALHTRRSIRKYTDKPVSDENIETILQAAMTAPSAGNQQPWQFIIITDRAILDKLASVHPYVGMLKDASLAVLVCGDLSLEKFAGYWVIDCSAAIQNLLLAAHDLGLGAVWTGLHPMQERVEAVSDLFNLPDHVVPHSLIPIGHTEMSSKYQNRYKEERVHHNKW